jgi:predicted nucleotidyltransferase
MGKWARGWEMKDLVAMFPMDEIAEFCRRWKIQEMAVFGSVLRADFDSESDILL